MSAKSEMRGASYVTAVSGIDTIDRVGNQGGWDVARPALTLVETVERETPLLTPPSRAYVCAKRAIDIVGSLTLLIALSPLFLILAIAVKRSSPGRVFFVQTRVGREMQPFRCLKFRTMVDNAELILLENPQLRDAMAVTWKIPDDPRITPLGRIMRKTSLDELPQLWNVFKGEMSLIGPRPYMPRELEGEFGWHARRITAVRPGITGLWQVSGRSHLGPAQRIALDETYVARVDSRTDARILIRTVKMVLINHGAF